MGEVYKAKDTRLDRTVAIKVLPADLATDPQFRERFEREAKSISALNHPNICTLHDVGRDNHVDFLVMEYLEGETLAARLAKGRLGLPEALRMATEIASAFDKAHHHGIVHRDLKPGNVFLVRSPGSSVALTAKLLDFGLAKVGPPGGLLGTAATALAPGAFGGAQGGPLTAQGTILGTLQYMAPEQIEGGEADARTDIFAFGVVLYEMLTGRKAFEGKSQASLLGAILKDQPPAVSQIQPIAPLALDYLVRTCLAKDPGDRFQSAHDLLLQLRWIADGGSAAAVPPPVVSRRRSREWFAWTIAAVLGAIAVGLAVTHLRETPAPTEPFVLTIAAADTSTLVTPPQFAISPDGRQIVFVASGSQGVPMLWVRPFITLAARPLPGTEGATQPFWSPDNHYVGFFADGKLKKVDVSGGSPISLCDSTGLIGGGTWSRNNVIVFAPSFASPLNKVDAAGGMSTPVTTLGEDSSHRYPSFLPDGQHVLYLALRGASRELRVASLGTTDTTSLGAAESNALYSSGHLLFSRGGTLMAQPFDPSTRQPDGDPFRVAEQVPASLNGRAFFSVSTTGVLGYFGGGAQPLSRLTWMDRTGKPLRVVGDAGAYANLSLSPNEQRVAVSMATGWRPNRDIWVIDLARADTASKLTSDPASESDPIWSPDGSQILFNSNRDGPYNSAFQRSADGGGQDVLVVKMERLIDSPDWSHDGRFLVFTGGQNQTSNDLWVLPFSGDRKPTVLLQTPEIEDSPTFSPDDRWIAYDSDATGRFEVYVRSFSPGGGQLQISRNGGWAPRWSGDGKEIFFLARDGAMMVADVTLGKDFHASVPRALFPTALLKTTARHIYAVTKDGKRFLLPVPDQRQASTPITVVLNWPWMVKK
jgi:eukaryotic-like serine/threonine-protein kinase